MRLGSTITTLLLLDSMYAGEKLKFVSRPTSTRERSAINLARAVELGLTKRHRAANDNACPEPSRRGVLEMGGNVNRCSGEIVPIGLAA